MKAFSELVKIFEKLNSPSGCSWDRRQTHKTLIKYLREETSEFISAVKSNNPRHIKDELGDILLQVLFHAQIAKKCGEFSIEDVLTNLSAKLRRRHPHVFGKKKVRGVKEIIKNWDEIKKKERRQT